MKKVVIVFLVTLIFTLSGCSKDSNEITDLREEELWAEALETDYVITHVYSEGVFVRATYQKEGRKYAIKTIGTCFKICEMTDNSDQFDEPYTKSEFDDWWASIVELFEVWAE